MKKYIGWIIVIAGIIVDQLSKLAVQNTTSDIEVIANIFDISKVHNYGIAFGLAQEAGAILAVISAIVCIIILIIIYRLQKNDDHVCIGLYLVLAGGVGNLIDRAFRGYVVDFIKTPFIATFNIADSMIVIGCFWIIIEELCTSIFSKKK